MLQLMSQRGKQYLKTAETVLRAAQTMTDLAIAGQLKALAKDFQRRAEKVSHVDAANRSRAAYYIKSERMEGLHHAQQ
jgi:hypothetical protein